MNNNDLSSRRETLIDHTVIRQRECAYCGTLLSSNPSVKHSGDTRYLDHFIPISILAVARQFCWPMRISNYLIPCCQSCNNLAGPNLFKSFVEKFNYVKSSLISDWQLRDNPQYIELAAIRTPQTLLSMIRPIEELTSVNEFIIRCPRQVRQGIWDASQLTEAILRAPHPSITLEGYPSGRVGRQRPETRTGDQTCD
jgi:hypothetical protein